MQMVVTCPDDVVDVVLESQHTVDCHTENLQTVWHGDAAACYQHRWWYAGNTEMLPCSKKGSVRLILVKLTLDSHVKAMSKAIYYLIRAFRHIRHALKVDTAKSMACALLGSRLDYANSVLFGKEPCQATAPTELCRLSCYAVGPSFASPSNTETTSLATSQIPDWLQDRGVSIQVEDNLGADVSVKSDLDVRAEAVPTICRRSTSTDTTCKICHRKPGFQICIAHDLERFTTWP